MTEASIYCRRLGMPFGINIESVSIRMVEGDQFNGCGQGQSVRRLEGVGGVLPIVLDPPRDVHTEPLQELQCAPDPQTENVKTMGTTQRRVTR